MSKVDSAPRTTGITADVFRPSIAWPTVLLALGSFILWAFSVYAGMLLEWPASATVPLSFLAVYVIFTPFHDAVHFAVSKDFRWLNEAVGWMSSIPFLIVPFPAFRFLHLRHHKYTNDPELDPDHIDEHLSFWYVPVAMYQWYRCLREHGHLMPHADIVHSWLILGCNLAALSVCYRAVGGWLVWQCFVLPVIVALGLLGFFFAFLPHRPPASKRAQGVAHGSTHTLDGLLHVTNGDSSFVLTCLLLGQNLHSVHHLYPTIPFYTYARAWREQKDQLLAAGVKVQSLIQSPRCLKSS